MEGRSADQARHAISSSRRPRVVLVFGKSQPKEPPPFSVASRAASPRVSGPPTTIASHPWPSTCHQAFTAGGAFRAPAAHPHRLLSPSAAQPLVAPLATSGWAGAVPSGRPAAARLTVSGTGVFLPPGNAVASGAGRPVESPPPKENGSVGDTVEKLPSCGREQSLQLNGSWSGGPGSGERAEGEEQQTARVGERAY
ncbi:unnamed protein product [Spirodela intermedia]|uniref:Uncharacterized protein n=1 Tax=Spirodela intermedia TaxID=51605 RepID=A0A7I8KWE0_SPIIN|nr:unnamed protein product [Spirodela intermedia]